ncbi:M28 family peptidase [Marinigracilibium pacificum]|uniref:M28 family peptidase n=1 Tax=Marinigracilibium pacificum TaxID=2729599 RepID=A0A848IY95_9BACT|nr:M28 family metallopeptidase [Marinigracilibium pacificum]NMM49473.1 M28 family peptidase [Marinigracilibium pacificum]
MYRIFFLIIISGFYSKSIAQSGVSQFNTQMYDIINNVSSERIESDIKKMADFGTRHTMSDTTSDTRGIGAARRWIKSTFDQISKDCDNCLEVKYQRNLVKKGESERIPEDTYIVNVLAIQRGTKYPNKYIIMSGDIDSRISDVLNYKDDSPGANDNASGMAGTIEAARVLSKYKFECSIIYSGLSGEEQGLFGGKFLAEKAKEEGWEILGVLNNDMIGNIEGVDGVIDNRSFRIFSEPVPPTETDRERRMRRFFGGEVDGISRQLARYVHYVTEKYMPYINPIMIYRLDRFGRGGHHRPFNDAGFAGIRIMEAHENYNRQHQDLRTENGIEYGDVIEGVNFEYARLLTAVNAITLASVASAPTSPENVNIGGIVEPSTKLKWDAVDSEDLKGYIIHYRETTAPQWQHSVFVDKNTTEFTLKGVVIDNYLFGVSAVDNDGNQSIVSYPSGIIRD